MADLLIKVESDRDFGTERIATRCVRVLRVRADWVPERFGLHDPVRIPFHPARFVAAWVHAETQAKSHFVLFKRSKRVSYRGTVHWWLRQAALNSVSFRIASRHVSVARLPAALEILTETFLAVEGEYAYACDEAEFISKNLPGGYVGDKAYGQDRTRHLPGVYWANVFGPKYVGFFGEGRLLSAPAHSKTRLDNGSWLILTCERPGDWEKPETRYLQEALQQHLGRGAFFSLRDPERETRAPRFEFSSVTPIRPEEQFETAQLSSEFFQSDGDTQRFLREIPARLASLRERIAAGPQLDLSPSSLHLLDSFVRRRAKTATIPQDLDAALDAAAYYGEVVRRTLGGRWILDPSDRRQPLVEVKDPPTTESPLLRVYKTWNDGTSIADWFDFVRKGGEQMFFKPKS